MIGIPIFKDGLGCGLICGRGVLEGDFVHCLATQHGEQVTISTQLLSPRKSPLRRRLLLEFPRYLAAVELGFGFVGRSIRKTGTYSFEIVLLQIETVRVRTFLE